MTVKDEESVVAELSKRAHDLESKLVEVINGEQYQNEVVIAALAIVVARLLVWADDPDAHLL
jgi:hypothetical protein